MFIRDAARTATPLGTVCRMLMASEERLRSLCFLHTLSQTNPLDLLDLEACILAHTNGLLVRYQRPFRVFGAVPQAKQHHILLSWAPVKPEIQLLETILVNLYPPSKRKPADDDEESTHASSEPACESAEV